MWRRGLRLILLSGANQERQAARWSDQGCGGGEDGCEVFDGAEGYYVESSRYGFGAGVLYIDVCQCKRSGNFAEEGSFLLVGFDQGEGDMWGPEVDGEARESCAGADIREGTGWFKILKHRGHGGHRGRHGVELCEGADWFNILEHRGHGGHRGRHRVELCEGGG